MNWIQNVKINKRLTDRESIQQNKHYSLQILKSEWNTKNCYFEVYFPLKIIESERSKIIFNGLKSTNSYLDIICMPLRIVHLDMRFVRSRILARKISRKRSKKFLEENWKIKQEVEANDRYVFLDWHSEATITGFKRWIITIKKIRYAWKHCPDILTPE